MNDFTQKSSLCMAMLLVLACLISSGCKSKPADDAALNLAVQSKLSSDTAIGSEPIQTATQKGVVTLSGSVSSDAARTLAASDVAQVPGVKTVIDNLVVQPQPVSASSAAPAPAPMKIERSGRKKPSAVVSPQPPPPAPVPLPEAPPAPVERAAATPPEPAPHAPPPPAFRSITLPADTTLPIRMNQTLDSATTQPGETFSGVIASDVLVDNLVVLPQGTPVSGKVDNVQEAAHFKGNALLSIELVSLDRKGEHVALSTDTFTKSGNGRGKNSAEKIGGGAAVGAILGGIFGGGKGAAIGAAAGGGAGAGVQAATRGQQVQIPAETLVRFRLTSPITLRVSTTNQAPSDDGISHRD
jgi:hypothetical protein